MTALKGKHVMVLEVVDVVQPVMLTERTPKKRASLHVVRGETKLSALNRGGIAVLDCNERTFAAALTRENHTLLRSRLFQNQSADPNRRLRGTARSPLAAAPGGL